METKAKKKHILLTLLIVVIVLLVLMGITAAVTANWHSDPEKIETVKTDNPYIFDVGETEISAHRSGGGIMPEETMKAFENCIENCDFDVDVFEFDLHITKDDVLVLLHDDTLDRTSDSETVFGVEEARPEDYTYEELRTLNMGAKFTDENGDMPYAEYSGDEVPEDIKIVRLEDVLDYLMSGGDFDYIIEIKNDGELGKKGVDILHGILKEKGLLDSVVFGTFNEEVSLYVDEKYDDMTRSATVNEALSFYRAALTDDEDFDPAYRVLQVPYIMPYKMVANFGTAKVLNYAHEKGIAVQYWTINDEEDMEYLLSLGADCIMTDYPDLLYRVKEENGNHG